MSNIEDVIRRSRQKGSFSERNVFSIAEVRAVKKMREFALKYPSQYILELIQATVALGATYLDMELDSKSIRIAWIDGFFQHEELQQIFDYLLADKYDEDAAAIRHLAIGINALIAHRPEVLIIESGDGTLENSIRVELDPNRLEMVAGTPTEPIRGGYIFVKWKKDRSLRNSNEKTEDFGPRAEADLVTTRCKHFPIPLILNGDHLFGYSAIRCPQVLGVHEEIKFDEGALYGTIGFSNRAMHKDTWHNTHTVDILTFGVHIVTVNKKLFGVKLGGVITHNALRKTADNASIVFDEIWDAMWAQVSMIIQENLPSVLKRRFQEHWLSFTTPSGNRISARKAQEIANHAKGVVLLKAETLNPTIVKEYEKVFGFPVLITSSKHYVRATSLFVHCELIQSEGSISELNAFEKIEAQVPKGPFFLPVVTVKHPKSWIAQLEFYSPKNAYVSKLIYVHQNREIKTIVIASAPPGFLIRVIIRSSIAPNEAWSFLNRHEDILAICSTYFPRLSLQIAEEYSDVLRCDSTGSRHLLFALMGRVIFSIAGEHLYARIWGVRNSNLLERKVLRTLSGRSCSIDDIVEMMRGQFGLIYGSLRSVGEGHDASMDLNGLDSGKILSLNRYEEEAIIGIFGRDAYIRVDDREVLTTISTIENQRPNDFVIRDIALGLSKVSSYLLYEGEEQIRKWTAQKLIEQLIQIVRNTGLDIERCRHAARHLIWTLCHPETPPKLREKIESVPLFLHHKNTYRVSYDTLDVELMMADGWALDACEKDEQESSHKTTALSMNPFVYFVLRQRKKMVAQANSTGTLRAELRKALITIELDNDFIGTMALMPREAPKTFTALLYEQSKQCIVYDALPERAMCAGELAFSNNVKDPLDVFKKHGLLLISKAVDVLSTEMDLSQFHSIAESAMFACREFVRFINPWEHAISSAHQEVEKLLNLLLFETREGIPISAHALMKEDSPEEMLSANAPSYQREWLQSLQMTGSVNLKTPHFQSRSKTLEDYLRECLEFLFPSLAFELEMGGNHILIRIPTLSRWIVVHKPDRKNLSDHTHRPRLLFRIVQELYIQDVVDRELFLLSQRRYVSQALRFPRKQDEEIS